MLRNIYLLVCYVITTETFQTIDRSMGKGYSFKTCSNSGRLGPTQYQCDMSYKFTDKKVKVLDLHSRFPGVQVWSIPETNLYSITALGASGGTGVGNRDRSKGGYVHAKFNLTLGDRIHMLIGQKGDNACSQTIKNTIEARICQHGIDSKVGVSRNNMPVGGGGGGATFVFKVNEHTGEMSLLLVAGGGGGMAGQMGQDPIRPNGGLSIGGPGTSQNSTTNGPGSGGSYLAGNLHSRQEGYSLTGGSAGGLPCEASLTWHISGGFGGGGGGCSAGGGGGGYTGGNISITNNKLHNGQGGSSYINPIGQTPIFEPGTNQEDGEVEIAFVLDCPCDFMCIYQNYQQNKFTCYCAPNYILDKDGLRCHDPKDYHQQPKSKTSPVTIFKYVLLAACFIVAITGFTFCSIRRFDRKKAIRLDHLTATDVQLDLLRHGQHQLQNTTGQRNALAATANNLLMTAYNPNYDFGGSKCTLQDLVEIKRTHLSLISALGQGAFGEVYQGVLTNKKSSTPEQKVAVKTLPALCTNQAEMDFLMEALIMSKFHHENIVHFIGVCFEKHPRFIILELLEGGDLKTFLRESRPTKDHVTSLTMGDLLKLALDVAYGCLYLEENHFIHRDIAARNCLLTSKNSDRKAKIADFGMARDIYRSDYYRKGGKALLPVKWMPPEAFLDGIFTLKTDIWSFGILLWEVCSMGLMPYPGHNNQEVMQLVTSGGRLHSPVSCHPSIYSIMCQCWHGVAEKRPTFNDLISKLNKCINDPQVAESLPPMFLEPAVIDTNVRMRPADPDLNVLRVMTSKRVSTDDDSASSIGGATGRVKCQNSVDDQDSLLSDCYRDDDDTGSHSSDVEAGVRGHKNGASRANEDEHTLDYDALLTQAAQSSERSRRRRNNHQRPVVPEVNVNDDHEQNKKLYMNVQ